MADEGSLSSVAKIWRYLLCVVACIISGVIVALYIFTQHSSKETPVPSLDVASMSFTVLNITETRLSARWDLAISAPEKRRGYYVCHQGDLAASILYKNVTVVISSLQKYNTLQNAGPHQDLRVSVVASEKVISDLIRKDLMEDIKEKKEVRFQPLFFVTDCKQKMTVLLMYVCDEAALRFQPGLETKASVYSGHCSIN